VERIQDPVLGAIEFPDEGPVRELLDLEVFQRTRHLLQLGPAHLVFPTAHHTRFSHSIGVYECCRRAVKGIGLRGLGGGKQMADLVEVAALLHDIGHYPLSHTLEVAYPALIGPVRIMFKGEVLFEGEPLAADDDGWIPDPTTTPDAENRSLLQYAADLKKPGPGAHHEKVGGLVVTSDRWGVKSVLERHDIDPQLVADIIQGQCTLPQWGRMLSSLVHSQFDADRLDYLLRDASTIGSTYGAVEATHLLGKMRLRADNGTNHISFEENAVPALDHFIMSRYFAYQAIIFHRAVCCFDVLARAAYLAMVKYRDDFPKTVAQVRQMASGEDLPNLSLLQYDDNLFWYALKKMAKEGEQYDEVTGTIANWVLSRQQPRVVKELRVAYTKSTDDDIAAGDPDLLAYEARKKDLHKKFLDACGALGVDTRLVFVHESSKHIYGPADFDWDPSVGLPESDSILVECEGDTRARPLESVQHSIVHAVGGRAFKFFRLYAPRACCDELSKALTNA